MFFFLEAGDAWPLCGPFRWYSVKKSWEPLLLGMSQKSYGKHTRNTITKCDKSAVILVSLSKGNSQPNSWRWLVSMRQNYPPRRTSLPSLRDLDPVLLWGKGGDEWRVPGMDSHGRWGADCMRVTYDRNGKVYGIPAYRQGECWLVLLSLEW